MARKVGRPRGLPKTGGRKRGTLNRVTADVRVLAQKHTADAVNTLVAIMADTAHPPAARVAAARELLDRGHGKSKETLALENEVPLLVVDELTAEDVAAIRELRE